MVEELETFSLSGKFLGVENRKKYYYEVKKEFVEKGKITRQVKTVRLLLMNSSGKIYLQKRSKDKSQNPGLYDKTIGGHVSKRDSWNMTTIRECAEELGFAASILDDKEFEKAKTTTNLEVVGLIRKIDKISNFESVRIDKGGNRFILPQITTIYIGYYDGAIRFIDKETSGIEVFSLNELKKEIKQNPDKFTEDIKFMIKKYEKYLHPIN